jgi:hypothetical protein
MNDEPSDNPTDPAFSDEDARLILRRAAEIEKEGRITASKLREIASEAQISPDALDRAVAEVQAGRQAVQNPPQSPEPSGAPNTHMSDRGWTLVLVVVAIAVLMMMVL